jgi:uncharacterized protein YjbI with pentapeptide repeats
MNMDENQDKLEEQPAEESQYAEEKQPELRKISEEELKKILEYHKKWLESDGKEGERADFQNTNLKGRSGHRADFKHYNLQGVRFRKGRWGRVLICDYKN